MEIIKKQYGQTWEFPGISEKIGGGGIRHGPLGNLKHTIF